MDALLAEADGCLGALTALAARLPPEARAEAAEARAALLDQAFAVTSAAQRLVAPEAAPVAPAPRPAPAAPAAGKVIEYQPHAAPERRKGRGTAVAFALALLAAGGYHGYGYWSARQRPPMGADLPEGYRASAPPDSDLRTITAGPGADRARFEKFRADQVARGKTVREIGPGVWMVMSPSNGRRATPPGGGGP
ncbi:hypothetical protein [Anaeromyxobacter paludicola]|uniref:hypothetical protein n=1 Tax=Anaeromyxobacter paludicola TaxID=2918171 RepID=UPI0020C0DAB1|nr:hypothetical protein [Anaeromyxobacter paludicola]